MTVSTAALKYPLDRTGIATTNKIVNEARSVGREVYRALAPYAGAFFSASMVVTDQATGTALTLNTDYKLLYPYQEAELEIGKPICTIVQILNASITDVYLTYQCVGGPYTTARDVLVQMITDLQQDDRAVTWDAILGKPTEFNPSKHLHSATDLYGMEYVVLALEELVQAVYTGDVSSHDVLYNYIDRVKAAMDTEIAALQDSDTDIRAQLEALSTRIDGVVTSVTAVNTRVTNHLADISNPHQVTKAQVGLDLVENYRPATQTEATAGTALNVLMTPLRGWQQIAQYTATNITPVITSHTTNYNNPHQVTATQVGLGNVQNFAQVRRGGGTGMLNNVVMLGWDGTKLLCQIDTTAMGTVFTTMQPDPNLGAHTSNTSNPHNTTATQVGLGSVSNYRMATSAEQLDGSSNVLYTTPFGVRAFVEGYRTFSYSAPPASTAGYREGHIWWKLI